MTELQKKKFFINAEYGISYEDLKDKTSNELSDLINNEESEARIRDFNTHLLKS